uniref:Uncharacterized protein n=1 Tax=Oryza punctata TaxID=4537 RepID=A0A0E0LS68_ORYPU
MKRQSGQPIQQEQTAVCSVAHRIRASPPHCPCGVSLAAVAPTHPSRSLSSHDPGTAATLCMCLRPHRASIPRPPIPTTSPPSRSLPHGTPNSTAHLRWKRIHLVPPHVLESDGPEGHICALPPPSASSRSNYLRCLGLPLLLSPRCCQLPRALAPVGAAVVALPAARWLHTICVGTGFTGDELSKLVCGEGGGSGGDVLGSDYGDYEASGRSDSAVLGRGGSTVLGSSCGDDEGGWWAVRTAGRADPTPPPLTPRSIGDDGRTMTAGGGDRRTRTMMATTGGRGRRRR